MSSVHVLQVLPEFDPGGAERIVLSLARHLPSRGFTVSVAALDGRGPLAAEFEQLGCHMIDLGIRRRFSPRVARCLRQVIRREQPTLVHSHLLRAHLATGRAVRGTDVPVTVATEHQADPRRWAMRLLRWASRRTTAITAVSEDVRQHLVTERFTVERLHTVANGIETEPIDRAAAIPLDALGLPADARVALFVGRLTEQKGLDVLLRAVAEVARTLPELHLLVAGAGEARESLTHLASRLGISARVRFLGYRSDVANLMKTAHVVVMPSRWEGLSLVLLEAMAAGAPVVASAVEGHRDLVTDGQTGLLVPLEDSAALAAAVERQLNDRTEAERMADAARGRVLAEFTAEKMTDRYAHLYRDLLAAAGL